MMQSRTRTSYKSHYPPLSPYNPQHSPSFPLYIPFYLYINNNNNARTRNARKGLDGRRLFMKIQVITKVKIKVKVKVKVKARTKI